MTESEKYMTEALAEAEKALAAGEVPIGAVMVRNGEIIARGHNLRNTDKNPLRHAEIDVIDAAAKIVGDWRLEDCVLYVTVEPCPCVRGQSCRRASQGWFSGQETARQAAPALCWMC